MLIHVNPTPLYFLPTLFQPPFQACWATPAVCSQYTPSAPPFQPPQTRAASHPGPTPLLAAVTQYYSPLGSCSQLCQLNLPLPNYKAPAFVDATSTGLICLVGHRNPRAGKPGREKKQSCIVLVLLYMVLGTPLVCLWWEVIPRNISHFLMGMKANGNLQLNLSFCFWASHVCCAGLQLLF